MIRGLLLSLLILLVFTGCTNKNQILLPKSVSKDQSIPKLNIITTAEIGENLYEKTGFISYRAEIINSEEVNVGSNFDVAGLLFGGLDQYFSSNSENGLNYNILKWKEYDVICNKELKCLVDTNFNNSFTHVTNLPDGKLEKLPNTTVYKRIPIFNENSFKYIALYQGKNGNSIKISFREFKDDLIRPAFTQDIDYELEKDGTAIIGFKGLRIEVLKATNLNITYKVIRDYN